MKNSLIKKAQKHSNKLILVVIAVLFLFISGYEQKNAIYSGWKSVLSADAAGYYIYLPTVFIYDFDAKKIPKGIEKQCADGFQLDTTNNIIKTKYFYGVSLMQLPFFLIAHGWTFINGALADGFSPIYHRAINISALFWLLFSCVFVFLTLKSRFNFWISSLSVASVVFGSTIYFYSFRSTGMSHVYSLAMFSLFMYCLDRITINKYKNSQKWLVLIGLSFSISILIRPTNILLGVLFLGFRIENKNDLIERFKYFFQIKNLLILFLIFIVILSPQLLYYRYLSGHLFHYSYTGESFTNWKNPAFLEVFFAPRGGLFLYAPITLISVIGMFFMITKKNIEGISIFAIFILISYISASWHSTFFGCSYGARNFTEYFAIFAIPIAFLLTELKLPALKVMFVLLIIGSTFYSQKIISSFDKCYFGFKWDWKEFAYYIKSKPTSFSYSKNQKEKLNEKKAIIFEQGDSSSTRISFKQANKSKTFFKHLYLSGYLYTSISDTSFALVVTSSQNNNINYQTKFYLALANPNQWKSIEQKRYINVKFQPDSDVLLYFDNPNNVKFALSDFKVTFK